MSLEQAIMAQKIRLGRVSLRGGFEQAAKLVGMPSHEIPIKLLWQLSRVMSSDVTVAAPELWRRLRRVFFIPGGEGQQWY
jgi:hypothetical protein